MLEELDLTALKPKSVGRWLACLNSQPEIHLTEVYFSYEILDVPRYSVSKARVDLGSSTDSLSLLTSSLINLATICITEKALNSGSAMCRIESRSLSTALTRLTKAKGSGVGMYGGKGVPMTVVSANAFAVPAQMLTVAQARREYGQ